MNFQKLFWGFVLLIIGFLLLFDQLDLFHIHWWQLLHFWPVILILWGVTLLPITNNIKAIISVVLVLLSILSIAYISNNKPEFFKNKPGFHFQQHNNDEKGSDPYFDADSNTTDI